MASKNDTNQLTYYIDGEPVIGIYRAGVKTEELTYYINGEPLAAVFPVTGNKGAYFLMFH
jgi:hypothetical protein